MVLSCYYNLADYQKRVYLIDIKNSIVLHAYIYFNVDARYDESIVVPLSKGDS